MAGARPSTLPQRKPAELRASATALNNRLTAIHHLAKALHARAGDLRLDAASLSFVAQRAHAARETLLDRATDRPRPEGGRLAAFFGRTPAPPPTSATSAGQLTALAWALADDADGKGIRRFDEAVEDAAGTVATLDGALRGMVDVLRDDAGRVREALGSISSRLGDPPFLAASLERLASVDEPAPDDVLDGLRATARLVLDAREAHEEAERVSSAIDELRSALAATSGSLADLADARAALHAHLERSLAAALAAPDGAACLETLAIAASRLARIAGQADALRADAEALRDLAQRAAALAPAARRSVIDLVARLTHALPARVARGEPLPSIVREASLLRTIAALADTPVGPAVVAWPDCDAWVVAAASGGPGRSSTASLLALAQARASLRHADVLDGALQRWAALATRDMPPATGDALAAKISWVRANERRLVELEVPRALGLVRLDESDLRGDRAWDRARALARGRARAHASLRENLAGKLPREWSTDEAARDALDAVVLHLLGPEEIVKVDVEDVSLAPLALQELRRRRVASESELAEALGATVPAIRKALARVARESPPIGFVYEPSLSIALCVGAPRDVDEAWRLRERVERAAPGHADDLLARSRVAAGPRAAAEGAP